jgi:hypothetical protein
MHDDFIYLYKAKLEYFLDIIKKLILLNFPFIWSNIPAAPAYEVYISHAVDTIFQNLWFPSTMTRRKRNIQWSTKHDWATRIALNTGMKLGAPEGWNGPVPLLTPTWIFFRYYKKINFIELSIYMKQHSCSACIWSIYLACSWYDIPELVVPITMRKGPCYDDDKQHIRGHLWQIFLNCWPNRSGQRNDFNLIIRNPLLNRVWWIIVCFFFFWSLYCLSLD